MKSILVATLLASLAPSAAAGAPKAAPAKAPAEDPRTTEAKAHFQRGAQLYREARYREAIAEFQAAYRAKPSPVLHFNIGQAQEKLGDIPAALASYTTYLREEPRAPNRETVQRAIANLQARLTATGVQMLYVLSDPPDAEVWVDGQARGRTPFSAALPLGPHAVAAAKPGYRTVTRDLVLSADRALDLTVALQPGASLAPPAAAAAAPSGTGATTVNGPAPGAAAGGVAAAGAAASGTGAPGPARASLEPSPGVLPPPGPAPGPAPRPVERKSLLAPIIAGSVAVVAAGTGIIMGVQARNAQDQLLGSVHDSATATQLATKARNDARTANILYGVAGAAALAGGGILVFGGYF